MCILVWVPLSDIDSGFDLAYCLSPIAYCLPYASSPYWNFRMGVSVVEARLLSGEDAFQQTSRLLLHATELRGGELHIPCSAGDHDTAKLDDCYTRRVYVCR